MPSARRVNIRCAFYKLGSWDSTPISSPSPCPSLPFNVFRDHVLF